jgi:trypsin
MMHRTRLGGAVLVAAACLLPAVPAQAQEARSAIVGGTQIPITSAPWQVFVYSASKNSGCGGSLLDARRVLTAAHCVADGTVARPPGDFTVLAGASEFTTWVRTGTPPAGAQEATVSGVRKHPYYEPEPYIADDVAVLTLARPLTLSTRVRPIALAGGAPAPGAELRATGYGAQQAGQPPNGRLYAGNLSAQSDMACLTTITPNTTAGAMCANGPTGVATCFGDSGGPLTAGNVLVGVTSATSGANACSGAWPGVYADVTAPEIRAFIDGSDAPPRAPRLSGGLGLSTVNPPVVGSPMTCAPGTWTDVATVSYTFLNQTSGQALQSGPTPTFTPTAAHLGAPIACVVQTANGGGVSTAGTQPAPAISRDIVPPQGLLRSARCRRRRCKIRFQAADSNSLGALKIRVAAERRVRGRCRKGKGRKRVRCMKRRSKRFSVRHRSGVNWVATAKRVPRGRATVRLRVTDAAGNRARGPRLTRRIRVR